MRRPKVLVVRVRPIQGPPAHPTDAPPARGRRSRTPRRAVGYWVRGEVQTMNRKTVDHPRKTAVNGRKSTVNSRISGPCYKSFRQNGDGFRRNFRSGNDLELWWYGVEFKSNPTKDLPSITTVARPAECIQHLTRRELTSPTQVFVRRGSQTKSNNPAAGRSLHARQTDAVELLERDEVSVDRAGCAGGVESSGEGGKL